MPQCLIAFLVFCGAAILGGLALTGLAPLLVRLMAKDAAPLAGKTVDMSAEKQPTEAHSDEQQQRYCTA